VGAGAKLEPDREANQNMVSIAQHPCTMHIPSSVYNTKGFIYLFIICYSGASSLNFPFNDFHKQ
jgi:hypothetical protein